MKPTLLILAAILTCIPAGSAPPGQPSGSGKLLKAKIGAPMPDFTLRDQNGKVWKLSALKGKEVIVTFGYTMCECGQAALKDLQTIQDKYGARGLQVLHVNMEPEILAVDPQHLARFAKENKIAFPLLADKDLSVSARFPIAAMPFLCLADKDGILRFTLASRPDTYLKTVTQQVEKYLPPPAKAVEEHK